MTDLGQVRSARAAVEEFSWDGLWALFDGDRDHLNIAAECLDRHRPAAVGARIALASGGSQELTFGELARLTSRFAHRLERAGIGAGERVGVMLEPSREMYTALFGVLKRGAVAVPLYPQFGPDAVRERLADCGARLLLVEPSTEPVARRLDLDHVVVDGAYVDALDGPDTYPTSTAAADEAVLQYTSGTTRTLPEAVRHDHRSVVTLARAGLFALGLRAGDRYFCPSSPAWGHGLWHGTIAPWSLGVAVGAYSGRYDTDRLVDALVALRIDNLAAASTVYRMVLGSGRAGELAGLRTASYTGEELSGADAERFRAQVGTPVCGMYGTTETGVVLVNFPGFVDHEPRPGALGKPMPGVELAVLDPDDRPVPPGDTGEICVRRRGGWFRTKDRGSVDVDGYFHYGGRADDVIISAGWTISPQEVERSLVAHPDVVEAAVVGVPDETRGQVVKAFLVTTRDDPDLVADVQAFVRRTLSSHEYPRQVERVDALPKTVNGKIDRKALRA